MNYDEAVEQLYFWQYGNTDSFHNILYPLFQKADSSNKAKLARSFPEEYRALKDWHEAGDYGNDLFRRHGLIK